MEMTPSSNLNRGKWAIVFCLLMAVIIGNCYYRAEAVSLRIPLIVAVMAAALWVASHTSQGAWAKVLINEAKEEVQREIRWPKWQVTRRFTCSIIVITMIAALVLWSIDAILVLIISYLTGLRG